jgi:hypothetical protein
MQHAAVIAVDKAAVGSFLSLRNAKVDMYRGSMRLAVDKTGSLEVAEGVKFQPKVHTCLQQGIPVCAPHSQTLP